MDPRLKRIIDKIKNKNIREEVAEIVENPQIEISGLIYSGLPLETSPASLTRHHSYPGGFIEHIVSTSEIALTLCDVVKKVYSGEVNRDIVLAGVMLHDIFKPLTYEVENESYSTSRLGEYIDHLTLITTELIRRGFHLDLVHIVCAHHGSQVGLMWPKTVEALICHLADQTDSQLNNKVFRAAKYLSRRVTGEELIISKSKEAFEIVHSKAVEGWRGVSKALEEIKRRRQSGL
ncbi:MAG: HD domain-containing protein [Candidatus Bathyarchaeota archaeon]|nr:MAG: HD domain-containing protein [Candidatus Bathyarchaeota archaeon]